VGCIGDGEITDETVDTFGTTGVLKIDNLPRLLYFLTANGFEHHVALNYSPRTEVLYEAFTKYMGWKIYHHNGEDRKLFEEF
jgi:L-fucose isomerase-like protein